MDAQQALLQAVRAAMRNGQVNWAEGMPDETGWEELVALAREQHVLPLVVQSCYAAPAFLALDGAFRGDVLRRHRQQVVAHTMRAAALCALCRDMESRGFHPVIMKGAACRSVWPVQGVRLSSDEDVLVPSEEFHRCIAFLKDQGFSCGDGGEDALEVGLRRADGLYIELHRTPFAPDDPVLGGSVDWFGGLWDRAITVTADGFAFRVMGAQDHMLLLILHAFKHLLHSGFGLRQVCDIVLWAEHYGAAIDWSAIVECCGAVRALGFARAVFRIGEEYLGMDTEKACLPPVLLEVEEAVADLLLRDLLSGGVYGTASLSRHHSAGMTLQAVTADRTGEKASLLRAVFPQREKLQGRYPYLRKAPWLLPVAWGARLITYGTEVTRRTDSDAAETLRIGRERTELLRKLDIMD